MLVGRDVHAHLHDAAAGTDLVDCHDLRSTWYWCLDLLSQIMPIGKMFKIGTVEHHLS